MHIATVKFLDRLITLFLLFFFPFLNLSPYKIEQRYRYEQGKKVVEGPFKTLSLNLKGEKNETYGEQNIFLFYLVSLHFSDEQKN